MYNINSRGYQGSKFQNQQNFNPNRPIRINAPKRSGAKMTMARTDKPFPVITAWKYARSMAGIVTLVACPKKESEEFTSKSGRIYESWVASIQVPYGKKQTFSAFYEATSGKLRIPDLNMVASTRAPNGGYFGKTSKPKK